MRPSDLDDYDLAILRLLQADNQRPQHSIGAEINLSTPAVQRRIKRLETSGVIRSNIAVIEPSLIGLPLTLLVGIKLDSERKDVLDATKRILCSSPYVQQCYYVTGNVDFMLIMVMRDMAEFERISAALFGEDPNIREFRTYVVISTPKAGLSVPL